MIIYRCTNMYCPRYGLRTERVCQAKLPMFSGNTCSRPAEKDRS